MRRNRTNEILFLRLDPSRCALPLTLRAHAARELSLEFVSGLCGIRRSTGLAEHSGIMGARWRPGGLPSFGRAATEAGARGTTLEQLEMGSGVGRRTILGASSAGNKNSPRKDGTKVV